MTTSLSLTHQLIITHSSLTHLAHKTDILRQPNVAIYKQHMKSLLYPFVWIMLIHDTGSFLKCLGKIPAIQADF